MTKHYELTDQTLTTPNGSVLHRIRATTDIPRIGVHKGDLGGWIESPANLTDSAWVFGNARVFGNALVFGNAQVFGNAWVFDNAQVCDDALVSGDARVYGGCTCEKPKYVRQSPAERPDPSGVQKAPTSDDLRTKIAATLSEVADGRAIYQMTNADAAVMADAVIRELGLDYRAGRDPVTDSDNSDNSLVPLPPEHEDYRNNDLRDRIAMLLSDHGFIPLNHNSIGSEDHCVCGFRPRGWREWSNHVSDAVIEELDDSFMDFGAWLAEEITGRAIPRIDLESCLQEWKGIDQNE